MTTPSHSVFVASGVLRTALAGLFMLALAAAAPATELSFRAQPVFNGYAKDKQIHPIRVELVTDTAFEGRILAQMKNVRECAVSVPLNVGSGSFVYELPLQAVGSISSDAVIVLLLDRRGRLLAKTDADVTVLKPFRGYSWYEETQPLLLAGWVGAGIRRPPVFSGRFLRLAGAQTRDLSEDWRTYDAVDCVVAPGAASSKFSEKQVDALLAWVRSGGKLLIDGFCSDAELGRNVLFNRLKVRMGDVIPDVPLKHQEPVLEPRPRGEIPQDGGVKTNALVTISVDCRPISMDAQAPGARAGLSADCIKLRSETGMGLGSIAITAVNLDQLAGLNMPEVESFLYNLIEDRWIASKGNGAQPSMYCSSYRSDAKQIPWWAVSVFQLAELKRVPTLFIIGFLVIFAAIVGPVERLVLVRTDRQRWTWLVTAALVLVFALLADNVSVAARGIRSRRSMVCVHDYAGDGGGAHSMFDCFIPARTRAVSAIRGPDDACADISAGASGASAFYDLSLRSLSFASPVWSPHFLLTRRSHREPAPFRVEQIESGTNRTVAVRLVRPGLKVRKAWLARNGSLREIRPAPNWGGAAAGAEWRGHVAPAGSKIPGVIMMAKRPLEPDEVEQGWINNLCALTGEPSLAAQARVFFYPAKLSAMAGGPDQAALIALCEDGESLAMDAANPKLRALHIVRQQVRLEAGL